MKSHKKQKWIGFFLFLFFFLTVRAKQIVTKHKKKEIYI